jgi:hypothetical protein
VDERCFAMGWIGVEGWTVMNVNFCLAFRLICLFFLLK